LKCPVVSVLFWLGCHQESFKYGHGIKGFVIPTTAFVKIGTTKYFVTTTKCLVLSTKRLFAATKNLFVVPNFVAVTKPFFSVGLVRDRVVCKVKPHKKKKKGLELANTSMHAKR